MDIFDQYYSKESKLTREGVDLLLDKNIENIYTKITNLSTNVTLEFAKVQSYSVIIFAIVFGLMFFFILFKNFNLNSSFTFLYTLIMLVPLSLVKSLINFYYLYNVSHENIFYAFPLKEIFNIWKKYLKRFMAIQFYIFFINLFKSLFVFIGVFILGLIIFLFISGPNFIYNVLFNLKILLRNSNNLHTMNLIVITVFSFLIGFIAFIFNSIKYSFADYILIESIINNKNASSKEIIHESARLFRLIGLKLLFLYYLYRPFSFWNFKGLIYQYYMYKLINESSTIQ